MHDAQFVEFAIDAKSILVGGRVILEVRQALEKLEPESDFFALVLEVGGRMHLHSLAFVVELIAGMHLHIRQRFEVWLVLQLAEGVIVVEAARLERQSAMHGVKMSLFVLLLEQSQRLIVSIEDIEIEVDLVWVR